MRRPWRQARPAMAAGPAGGGAAGRAAPRMPAPSTRLAHAPQASARHLGMRQALLHPGGRPQVSRPGRAPLDPRGPAGRARWRGSGRRARTHRHLLPPSAPPPLWRLSLSTAMLHHVMRWNVNVPFLRSCTFAPLVATLRGQGKPQPRECLPRRRSGPGAANMVLGLAQAKLAYAPVVVLTGLPATEHFGRDTFQEIEQHVLFQPVTKHTFSMPCPERIPEFILHDLGRPWRPRTSGSSPVRRWCWPTRQPGSESIDAGGGLHPGTWHAAWVQHHFLPLHRHRPDRTDHPRGHRPTRYRALLPGSARGGGRCRDRWCSKCVDL